MRERYQNREKLTPSPELAWIIGTLSGKGTVDVRTGQVSPGNQADQVQKEFVQLGEQIFGITIPYRPLRSSLEGVSVVHLVPSFFNTRIARALGNLSRTQFPSTIADNHAWILQDPTHALKYTEGLFEVRGKIYKRSEGESKDILFQTSYLHVSEFIANVLTKLDVNPTIIRVRIGVQQRTKGVTVSTLREQKRFAEFIHSKDPEKEAKLDELRKISLGKAQTRVRSRDELIGEWKKMTDLLGFPPNVNEIDILLREGKTRWSHQAYTYWFGETGKRKSFSAARRELISITNPELVQKQLEVITKRHQSSAVISQKRAERLNNVEERERRQAELDQTLQPSQILAWILGLLASGGHIDLKNGKIAFASSDQSLQKAFIDLAGNLFRTNLRWQPVKSKAGERLIPQYNNTRIARGLGDLRRSIWPATIVERHSWLFESPNYKWAFLSGVFDDKGYFLPTRGGLIIPTSHRNVANFLTELMVSVGIQKPLIIGSSSRNEGVQGVAITNLMDLQKFAENIDSRIPKKAEMLKFYREGTGKKQRNQAPIDENEMIAEWRCIYETLGHIPNVTDITMLYAEGKTRWSVGVYARVFGGTGTNKSRSYKKALSKLAVACGLISTDQESIGYRHPESKYVHIKDASDLVAQYRNLRAIILKDKGRLPSTGDFDRARKVDLISYSRVTFANYFGNGSLVEAIRELEKLVFIEEVNLALERYEELSRRQVRFTPKQHFSYDYSARNRLDRLLSKEVPKVNDGQLIFLGPTGHPINL